MRVKRESSGELQSADGKITAGIGPAFFHCPARTTRQGGKGLTTVLVAVLGVNGFTRPEVEGCTADFYLLTLGGGEMHFDAAFLAIVEGMMLELIELEITTQLTIDAAQQIEIE